MTGRRKGKVRFWDVARGFGFLTPADGQADVFVHSKEFARSRLSSPKVGECYSFDLKLGANQKIQAYGLVLISRSDPMATNVGGAQPAAVFGQGAAAGNLSSGGQ